MIPVVRVINPGMENWYHDKKRIGKRLYKAIYNGYMITKTVAKVTVFLFAKSERRKGDYPVER